MDIELGLDVVREVMATGDAFLRESQRLFRPHGLTSAQYNVLALLGAAPDGLNQREISDALVVDRSNVTGLLDRLEQSGWVARTDHPTDRRAYRVILTVAGRDVWLAAQPRYHEVVRQVIGRLSAAEARRMCSALRRLREGAAEWQSPEPAD